MEFREDFAEQFDSLFHSQVDPDFSDIAIHDIADHGIHLFFAV